MEHTYCLVFNTESTSTTSQSTKRWNVRLPCHRWDTKPSIARKMIFLEPRVMIPLAIQQSNQHVIRWPPLLWYCPLKNKLYGWVLYSPIMQQAKGPKSTITIHNHVSILSVQLHMYTLEFLFFYYMHSSTILGMTASLICHHRGLTSFMMGLNFFHIRCPQTLQRYSYRNKIGSTWYCKVHHISTEWWVTA